MLRFATALTLLLSIEAGAQETKSYGVYISDKDYKLKILTGAFDSASGNRVEKSNGDGLLITIDSITTSFPYDNIWGFRESGVDYRVYGRRFYRVNYSDSNITIYTLPGSSAYDQPIAYDERYFSASPGDDIYELTKRHLRKVYARKEDFNDKLDDAGYNSIRSWDSNCKCYLIAKVAE